MDTLIPNYCFIFNVDPLKLESVLPHLFIIVLPFIFIFLHTYGIFLVLFKLSANQGTVLSLCVSKFPPIYYYLT